MRLGEDRRRPAFVDVDVTAAIAEHAVRWLQEMSSQGELVSHMSRHDENCVVHAGQRADI